MNEHHGRQPSRRLVRPGAGRLSVLLLLAASGGVTGTGLALGQDGEPPRLPPVRELPPAFSEELNTVENDALDRLRRKDLRRLSIREVSLFHRRLVRTLDPVLPKDVAIRNGSPLATEGRRQPVRINGLEIGPGGLIRETDDVSEALSWYVDGVLGIFTFWISTARTNSTVAVCEIERRKLFVNVDWISDFRSVDDKLPELGGRTVRELLRLLEQPPPDPDGEEPADASRPAAKPAPRAGENDSQRRDRRIADQ